MNKTARELLMLNKTEVGDYFKFTCPGQDVFLEDYDSELVLKVGIGDNVIDRYEFSWTMDLKSIKPNQFGIYSPWDESLFEFAKSFFDKNLKPKLENVRLKSKEFQDLVDNMQPLGTGSSVALSLGSLKISNDVSKELCRSLEESKGKYDLWFFAGQFFESRKKIDAEIIQNLDLKKLTEWIKFAQFETPSCIIPSGGTIMRINISLKMQFARIINPLKMNDPQTWIDKIEK